jgi:fructose-1,6-bisphosphatase/sedoheptulose 1,7-bisphosphatase-like protein
VSLLAIAVFQAIPIHQTELAMHTAIIIFFGLVLLALMLYIGERIGFSRQTMAYGFAALWLALTVINGAVGVVRAGQSVASELAIGSAVFGVPVAAMVLFMVLSAES